MSENRLNFELLRQAVVSNRAICDQIEAEAILQIREGLTDAIVIGERVFALTAGDTFDSQMAMFITVGYQHVLEVILAQENGK